MHPSDTLVFGPLPVVGHSIRLPLGVVPAGVLAAVAAAIAALVVADVPVASPLRSLALRTAGGQQAVAPAAVEALTWLRSEPAGADILFDGQVVAQTPAEVAAGHVVALRRAGAPDVRVLDTSSSTVVPV